MMSLKRVESLTLAISVAVSLVFAASRLPYPFMGDQALFLVGARVLADGGTLYVDFWDNKQPGIYLFYEVAGRLLGFTPVAVHLCESIWLAAAAVLLTMPLYRELQARWIALFTPLMTVGLFYSAATVRFLTQVEILVALPLALCFYLACAACSNRGSYRAVLIAFGAAAGIVATFKLILTVVPAAMWLVVAGYSMARSRRPMATALFQTIWPVTIGAAIPLALLLAHFALRGAVGALIWANFVYPAEAAREVAGKPVAVIMQSGRWLARILFPMIPLAAFAFYDLKRKRLRIVETLAFAWLAAGALAIAVQWFSWWDYHFTLLLVPVGVLAVCALDRAVGGFERMGLRATVTAAGVAAMVLAVFAFSSRESWRAVDAFRHTSDVPGVTGIDRFRAAIDPTYGEILEQSAFLRAADARPGDIYVFGDPRIVFLSGRRYALPTHGWSWEVLLESQWQTLERQLRATRPVYVFVANGYEPWIKRRSPGTWQFLSEGYSLARLDPSGKWFKLRSGLGEVAGLSG